MRKTAILLTIIFLTCILGSAAQAYNITVTKEFSSNNAYIPKGTVIEAELITSVNSADNDPHDIAYFKLKQNVVINGTIVLPSGTVGNAYVKTVKRSGFFKKDGIELTIDSVQALNGTTVPLTANIKKYGYTANMFIPYLLIGLFDAGYKKLSLFAANLQEEGKEIPAGTKFLVAVDSDVDLGCVPEKLPVVMVKKSY